jgi:hypothetical protein
LTHGTPTCRKVSLRFHQEVELVFVGHLAVALGAKKVEPRMPLAAGVAASYGIDLLWPVLLLAGVERVSIEPGATAFTPLAFESYPWSHSLLMVALWAIVTLVVATALSGDLRVGGVLAGLVLSHWALDAVVHRPDLPLWPDGPVVGLGLWDSIAGTFLLEGTLLAGGVWLYHSVCRAKDRSSTVALGSLVALSLAIWVSSPFAPPPPSTTAIAVAGFALWLFVPWAHWIERTRDRPVRTLDARKT